MDERIDKFRVEKEAKHILDKFAKALEKVEKEDEDSKFINKVNEGKLNFYVERGEFERVEGEGEKCDEGFKQRILENAPNKDEDFIIAEKGSWKQS